MLPMVSVHCTEIADYIWPQENGPERSHGDAVYGRALARIVAHELFHYLTGEAKHAHYGIFGSSISANDLLSNDLKFTAAEITDLELSLSK